MQRLSHIISSNMPKHLPLLLLFQVLFPALYSRLAAETAAEQWVRAQITSGKNADLAKHSPNDTKQRVLTADFLAKVLSTKSGLSDRVGISISHGVVSDELDLERLDAIYDIELSNFDFRGPVDLSGAHFHRSLSILQSTFENTFVGYRLEVDGDLAIGGPPLNMPGSDAQFRSSVSMRFASVGGQLAAHRAHFNGIVDFSGIEVHGRGVFQKSRFADSVNLTLASFGGEANLDETSFTRRDGAAGFNSMKVGHVATFNLSQFAGDVDFSHMQISSNFQASGMRLIGTDHTVKFSYMKVGRFALEDDDFSHGFVQMVGLATTDLDLGNVQWPDHDRFVCEDVTYDRINVAGGSASTLLKWPASSRYSSSTYAALASYLADHGNSGGASTVRVDRQKREAETLDFPHWIWDKLKFFTCGYGERPWYAFAWIGVFVAFGWAVFRHRAGMELIDPNQPDPGYDPFWYSLGLFLPVVDIGLMKAWRPKCGRRFAHNYAHVHVLLGWVFVPIAVASISGILR